MARMRRPEAVPATGGLPARQRNHDRPQRVARAVIRDARRGPQFASALEMHLQGLGTGQLKHVVGQLFLALAEAHAAQHNSAGES